jgi:hypothetical protein
MTMVPMRAKMMMVMVMVMNTADQPKQEHEQENNKREQHANWLLVFQFGKARELTES